MGNWNISGSQCELNSVPTSPTQSSNADSYQRQLSSESSVSLLSNTNRSKSKEKSRYLRDRLESINPNESEEITTSTSMTTFKRVNSFNTSSKPVSLRSGHNFMHTDENSTRYTNELQDEVEPYAWLSQTAPASPLNGRSRSCSRNRGEDQYLFYLDGEHEDIRKSRGSGQFTSLLIGSNDTYSTEITGSQSQINALIAEGASASIEKIGDKFKRKLRQTLNSMDQHSSGGMPAVQRARTTKGKHCSKSESDKRTYIKQSPSEHSPQSDENEYRPENFMRRLSFDLTGEGNDKLRSKTRKRESQTHKIPSDSPNIEDKKDTIIDCKFEEHDESLDSTCSSPEQETVRPKKSSLTCTRGPHVQDLFSRGSETSSVSMTEPIPNSSNDETNLSIEGVDNSEDLDNTSRPNPKDI